MRGWWTAMLAVMTIGAVAGAQQPAKTKQTATSATGTTAGAQWEYYGKKGPSHWARLDPAYAACSDGKRQSPIDIRGARVDRTLKPLEFHYMSGPVTMVNNGHTVRIDVPPGGYLIADGTRYDLVQFHFHHPGQTPVNGRYSDLELHLVHKNAQGETLVVAVLMKEGSADGVLAALWPHLPGSAGSTAKVDESISPAGLLPPRRGYYVYTGSLSEPPCTEGVRWYVMQQTTELSGDQLAAFAALYPDNTRPVQPTGGRKILATE